MEYQNYNDYMRNVLGYSNMNCPNMCASMPTPYQNNMSQFSDNLERMYPDTYRIVYPMVVSACNTVTMPVTEEMLDRMTDDIYDRAMVNSSINVDINIGIESREDNENRQISSNMNQRRPRRNRFFRDLIRILILRELLERRPRFPHRPF